MLYDPTIFENVKVALENEIYDLDNLSQAVVIQGRQDLMDLAVLSRRFMLAFALPQHFGITAEVELSSSLHDLAGELLQLAGTEPIGCRLDIRFRMKLREPEAVCAQISSVLSGIWGPEPRIAQHLTYTFGTEGYLNRIDVTFDRKIGEEQMDDLAELLDYVLRSLRALHELDTQNEQ
ncbi:hypothetical protein Q5741_16655 [Paenibacillus sp. JX-17]|uniref:Uncharacterized protein n=1 Tax=Paenibacillus lacisoli TaxID=3064525 RepID=A0ABT9CFJ5_9BACL|nr:hypothetical protein [Paenibacillus sp. JX-17]MDO7908045.1 hypothetical protein [Paenibacillus sp. JX-17]